MLCIQNVCPKNAEGLDMSTRVIDASESVRHSFYMICSVFSCVTEFWAQNDL